MNTKQALREKARHLRQEGMTLSEISQIVGVSSNAVQRWVRDMEISSDHNPRGRIRQVNAKKVRWLDQEEGRARARESRPLHRAGCMLYWAEGAKTGNGLTFVNSDPNMILLFMRFLREELQIDDTLIALRIQCHTVNADEISQIERYWLNLLKLPSSSLRKTQIKKGNDAVKHKNYPYGFCTVGVYRNRYLQHVLGAIQEYSGFDNPEWLV
jgi:hypothetical protein